MPLFFALTLFLSAILLFLIQPMIAKAILPLLGGTPAVWNTCMVFFQAALLAGYAYAHATTGLLGVRKQALLHLVLLLVPLAVLPIAVAEEWAPSGEANPVFGVLTLLALSVGLPFFVVSTTAPLVQKWFAHTGHPSAADPYFLYGASNLGSMLALLGYPALVEPALPLKDQTWWWAIGYGAFVLCMFGCAFVVWRSPVRQASLPAEGSQSPFGRRERLPHAGKNPASGPPTFARRLHWIALAFVPSSLMLGVTTLITLDIASIPLLWVIPLAIYLLSFILVFSRLPALVHKLMVMAMPVVVLAVVFIKVFGLGIVMTIVLHLVVLFVVAMVCHGELARTRPPAEHLTEFYLWMSLGGVLGGLFNALVAPVIFTDIWEYYVVLCLAGLLLPRGAQAETTTTTVMLDYLLPVGLAALALIAIYGMPKIEPTMNEWGFIKSLDERIGEGKTLSIATYAPLFVICYAFSDRPVRFGLGLAFLTAVILISQEQDTRTVKTILKDRSFFGVVKVREEKYQPDQSKPPERHIHSMVHGTTLHGKQHMLPEKRREAVTYYHKTGPIGQLFEALAELPARENVAVVGLGTGSLACYAEKGQHWTYYEIDPVIERIARNPEYFTFLSDCPASVRVVLGDARLKLKEAPDGHYGLIIVDAFSSDAIPIHLLTREALELYFRKLRADGLLVMHISNRYLRLEPVLGRLADEVKLAGIVRFDNGDDALLKTASHWVVLAREPGHFGNLIDHEKRAEDQRWATIEVKEGAPLWTDDFSNLLGVFNWRQK